MSVMIKLRLDSATDFASLQRLPGLQGVILDSGFGLVCINPKDKLFVVRAKGLTDLEQRRKLSPEILEVYGDVSISAV